LSGRNAILITGGAGYIGSHAALALKDRGRDLVVLDDLSSGDPRLVGDLPLVRGSIGDAELVLRVIKDFGCSAILHFAGSILVDESMQRPLEYYRNNVSNTLVLLEAALRSGIGHFIFSSTAAVYGEGTGGDLSENDPAVPINPYGRSKLMVERLLTDAAMAHGLCYVALRYFNVAGADPLGRSGQSSRQPSHLIKIAAQAAIGLRPNITINGTDYPTPDGTCIRDYIHVSDLAEAHVQALQHLESGGESLTLNCGYGRGHSVREVLAAVEAVTGQPLRKRSGPRRPGDPARLVADCAKLRRNFDWKPRHDDIHAIVETAIAWERLAQASMTV